MKYIILCLGLLFVASCGNEYVVEDNFDLEELPGYVAFDAPGNGIVLDEIVVLEDAGSTSLTIECPTGTLSDITVTYSVSGDAVQGVDYDIAGLTGNTGTVVISPNEAEFLDRDNVDLVVDLYTDDVVDGVKSLIITLESATNAEGSVAVGRGGTDLLKVAVISIGDVDCESNLAGTYDYVSSDFFCEGGPVNGSITISEVSFGVYTFNDFGFGTYEVCYGGTQTDWGTLQLIDICNELSYTGEDSFGDTWTITTESVDGPNWTFVWDNTYGETGRVVITRTDGSDWPPFF